MPGDENPELNSNETELVTINKIDYDKMKIEIERSHGVIENLQDSK